MGPSTSSEDQILELAQAGMDVARLNFSHGDHEFHRSLFENVRKAESASGRTLGIMQDLQGPKLRLGILPEKGVEFKRNDQMVLFPEDAQKHKCFSKSLTSLPVTEDVAKAITHDVKEGGSIHFDDGKIIARVLKVQEEEVLIEFENGGCLTSRKGINLPGTRLSIPSLTEKDLQDLKLGVSLGVDAIALSFVRSAQDIEMVQDMLKSYAHRPKIIAKMEREEGILDYEAIIDAADGLLIARGDMAVELGADRVPIIQKQLIRACNAMGVPVITATQMLESMIQSPTPTRAEANDVANAVFDGTDAVMLSGETASGKYPVLAVKTMERIILEAEKHFTSFTGQTPSVPTPASVVESIEFSAARIAQHVGAKVILCITHSGRAARSAAKFRPTTPIIAVVDQVEVLRALSFVWGVRGIVIPKILGTDDLFVLVEKLVKDFKLAAHDDLVVITAGIPSLRRGTTNMIKVHQVGAPLERAGKWAQNLEF